MKDFSYTLFDIDDLTYISFTTESRLLDNWRFFLEITEVKKLTHILMKN